MEKKTSIWHFAMYVIVTFVAIVIAMHLTSCTSRPTNVRLAKDSTAVANQIDSYMNPTFDNVSEVLKYKEDLSSNFYEDSVFRSMSPTLIYNISTVVVNRDGYATIRSIVSEYDKGRDVYDHLPKVIPDSIEHKIPPLEITRRDTVIDGKNRTIKTTVEYE